MGGMCCPDLCMGWKRSCCHCPGNCVMPYCVFHCWVGRGFSAASMQLPGQRQLDAEPCTKIQVACSPHASPGVGTVVRSSPPDAPGRDACCSIPWPAPPPFACHGKNGSKDRWLCHYSLRSALGCWSPCPLGPQGPRVYGLYPRCSRVGLWLVSSHNHKFTGQLVGWAEAICLTLLYYTVFIWTAENFLSLPQSIGNAEEMVRSPSPAFQLLYSRLEGNTICHLGFSRMTSLLELGA